MVRRRAVAVGIGSDLNKAFARDGYVGVVERAKAYMENLSN